MTTTAGDLSNEDIDEEIALQYVENLFAKVFQASEWRKKKKSMKIIKEKLFNKSVIKIKDCNMNCYMPTFDMSYILYYKK